MIIKLIHTFNRFDVNSEKKEETFSGDNYQEVFKDIYRYRKTFKYCDDGFKFSNKEDEVGYNNWYNSLSDREKFDLYYEGTTID